MPNGQVFRGKDQLVPFLKASVYAALREPVVIGDRFADEWGVFEYWNIGTVTNDLVEFAKQSRWPIPQGGHIWRAGDTRYRSASCTTSMPTTRSTWSGNTSTSEAS
jgi:hypothetical protein